MKLLLTGSNIVACPENHPTPELSFQLQRILSCDIYNTVIPGTNSGGLVLYLPSLVFNQPKCNYLIISAGTNDLATHKQVSLRQLEKNLGSTTSGITWLYYLKKVISIILPAVDGNKQKVGSDRLVMEYSNTIKEVASEYKFSVIDLANKTQENINFPEVFNGKENDGLHFGVNGYKLLANLAVKKID